MVSVKALSHVGIRSSNPEVLADYYSKVLGLETTATKDGSIYMRCNQNHHCLVIVPADEPGFDHVSLLVDGESALHEAEVELQSLGYDIFPAPNEPGQGKAIRLEGPDGILIELIAGMEQIEVPLTSNLRPRKIGHINFVSDDPVEFTNFWKEVLGFSVTDQIEETIFWMTCNPDHHVIAVGKMPRTRVVHHYAWELNDFSEFKAFCDRQLELGYATEFGPGRHGPGDNLFTYQFDPDGNRVELFAELAKVWEGYKPKVWEMKPETINIWGPAPPPSYFLPTLPKETKELEVK